MISHSTTIPPSPLWKRGEGGFEKKVSGEIANPPASFKVYIGMRYWRPFIEDMVADIQRWNKETHGFEPLSTVFCRHFGFVIF